MTSKPITIAEEYFPSLQAVTRRLSALLGAGGIDDPITKPEDTALLHALFHARPEKAAELKGRRIVGWGRERTNKSPCFAALLDTGEKLHFSYPKSLKALYAAQDLGA